MSESTIIRNEPLQKLSSPAVRLIVLLARDLARADLSEQRSKSANSAVSSKRPSRDRRTGEGECRGGYRQLPG
jgi:hypothetical protein